MGDEGRVESEVSVLMPVPQLPPCRFSLGQAGSPLHTALSPGSYNHILFSPLPAWGSCTVPHDSPTCCHTFVNCPFIKLWFPNVHVPSVSCGGQLMSVPLAACPQRAVLWLASLCKRCCAGLATRRMGVLDLGRKGARAGVAGMGPLGLGTNTALYPSMPVMCHCRRRGSQLLLGQESHLHIYKQGGVAQVRTPHPSLGPCWVLSTFGVCLQRGEMPGMVDSAGRWEGEPLPRSTIRGHLCSCQQLGHWPCLVPCCPLVGTQSTRRLGWADTISGELRTFAPPP